MCSSANRALIILFLFIARAFFYFYQFNLETLIDLMKKWHKPLSILSRYFLCLFENCGYISMKINIDLLILTLCCVFVQ